jgi:hypothetical protein
MQEITTEQIHNVIRVCNAGLIHLDYTGNRSQQKPIKKTASHFEELLKQRAAEHHAGDMSTYKDMQKLSGTPDGYAGGWK